MCFSEHLVFLGKRFQILCYSNLLLVTLLVANSIHRNLTEWELCNRDWEGWKVVAPSPASSMALEAQDEGREWDKPLNVGSWVPESLEAATDSTSALAAPWIQSPGSWSHGGRWHQPPWGWHRAANQGPFTCQSCTPSCRLGARQVGKEFSSQALSCLQVLRSFSARGTMLILEFFSCWFFELLSWLLPWLFDSQKYWCEVPLPLSVSEYFVHWTPPGGFG